MRFITPSEIETIIGKRTREVSGCSSSRGIEILAKTRSRTIRKT